MSANAEITTILPTNPNLAIIDQELAAIDARREELLRKREEEANSETLKVQQARDLFMRTVGVTDIKDAIKLMRNSVSASPSKAKRMTDLQIRQMKHVLTRGASAPATAKWFKVALATVHTRKKAFGLVGRKNMKTVPFAQAMKGMPQV